MKKKQLLSLVGVVFCMTISTFAIAQFKINKKTIDAGTKILDAATLTDEDVAKMTREYIKWMDEHNPVATGKDPYAIRLKKIVAGLTEEDGLKLNFKVYLVKDVNAFACATGDVRVFAGLMKIMTDDEIRAVIGHEIGHVANHDTKDAIKTAYLASAAKDVVGSQGGVVGAMSQSQLGNLAESLANAQFSKSQETDADKYGLNFLKKHQWKLNSMADAFRKLKQLEDEAGGEKSATAQLFSSHPSTEKRIKKMEKMAQELEGQE